MTVQGGDTDEQRIADLVDANHILASLGVNDGYGHVSVRSVKNPTHYFMSRSRAPALVSRADIIEFDADSQPIDGGGRRLYGERPIHGETYRARPDVQSVVHAHPRDVLPFTLTSAPFLPVIHMAFFLGAEPTPVFDSRSVEGESDSILVLTAKAGATMAKVLGRRSVVLMRGHGITVAGPSVQSAVYQAIYTVENARVRQAALALGDPAALNAAEVERMPRSMNYPNVGRTWEIWLAAARASRVEP